MRNTWLTKDIKLSVGAKDCYDAEHKHAGYLFEMVYFESRKEARRYAVEMLKEKQEQYEAPEETAKIELTPEYIDWRDTIEKVGEAILMKKGGWYVMKFKNQIHEIWNPSEERLDAHWAGFLQNNGI